MPPSRDRSQGDPRRSPRPKARGGATLGVSPARRLAACAAGGSLTAVIVAAVEPWWLIPLAGRDASAATLLVATWRSLWPTDATRTAGHATRESPSRAYADVIPLSGSLVSLVAVGLVRVRASHEAGLAKGLLVGMSVASIVLAWAVVHTVYTLRYAKLFYEGKPEGVDFNDDASPDYADFLYLALTIGMTFQVSDADLTAKAFRRLAPRHALLSYIYGALIIATTINLIAGLGKQRPDAERADAGGALAERSSGRSPGPGFWSRHSRPWLDHPRRTR